MSNIDSKVDLWQEKLLDLGKRNRMINFKETARTTLKITYPSYEDLFTTLVKNEASIAFPLPQFEEADNEPLYITDGSDNQHSLDYGGFGSIIRTNKEVKDLQKILRSLRNKAKTAAEEQGINVLFLCFGFLKWTEAEHSSIEYAAPLILVPITLTVESITAPFVMSLHEDEIVVNPTLTYKLKEEFGLKLPEFDESISLDEFFNLVNDIVRVKQWSVSKDVGMSLLSFLKINMYKDLSNHRNTIVSNAVVRALCGDNSGLARIPDGLADYDFDKKDRPQDVFQIVDADASQQEAILLAKNGMSFVLQGPPGTGKSQTITNIIAESLAAGKKVLFVSEKMAALEVVHRRLQVAGLADFCLVLHSHKTSKRAVLDQLEASLNLSRNRAQLTDEARRKMDALQHDKEQLNEYAEQVYSIVMPLEKSIYEVNGIIANLEEDGYKDVVFPISDIKATTKEQYYWYLDLLDRFASIIGKMTGNFKNNPWRGTKLTSVTNEFRHDANAKLSAFLPELSSAGTEVDTAYEAIYSVFPKTINGIASAEKLLESLQNSYEIPYEWITADNSTLLTEIEEHSVLQKKCLQLASEGEKRISALAEQVAIERISSTELLDIDTQIEQLEKINTLLTFGAPFFRWINYDNAYIASILSDARKHSEDIKEILDSLLQTFEEGILSIDYQGILGRFKSEYTSAFKVFKKSYKEDKKVFLVNSKEIGRKISDDEMIKTVEALRNLAELRKWYRTNEIKLNELFGNDITSESSDYSAVEVQLNNLVSLRQAKHVLTELNSCSMEAAGKESIAREEFKFLYNGIFTDWEETRKALYWSFTFKKTVEQSNPNEEFVKKICSSKSFADECLKQKVILSNARLKVNKGLDWFGAHFEKPEQFESMNIDDLYDRMNACLSGLSLLEEWIDFRTARYNCVAGGLGEFINIIEENSIPADELTGIFKKRFFRLWLDAILPDYPAVLNFRRSNQDHTVNEFARLDTIQLSIARDRIRGKLINELPSMEHFTTGVDEVSILKRELARQRRIMPIRKLFAAIPNLLLTLKPCLMMSPLSVSLFLEADSYKFDIVIFDEASQVYTENAVGAISRGKQVVIAGDSKQLPPTNFFQANVAEGGSDYDDDENEEDIPVFDSILDEANLLPERTLRWHYRSRHESLIAFSNSKIYKNRLITFPSNTERNESIGVEYVYVEDGFYERGGHKGNVTEAKEVARLVFEHIQNHPDRSLGVIAFGEAQQYAIETALLEIRRADQQFEDFFSEDKEEAFFIKSLENVQGDERDTILFSIGYARDRNGSFRMNFGPLGKSGGERRLNVAITRAKYNIKLVGSILPQDIKLDNITMEGPKLLRSYIDYAINGEAILDREITDNDIAEHDSPFEEAVFNFLERKGYKLGTQVGCSGYRIDIGVKHPCLDGVYVLGIECDGASYHSARTARERDRLRQEVLEKMGWRIYRIWSTDWIKDQASEGKKLIDAIEQAMLSYNDRHEQLKKSKITSRDEFIVIEETEPADNNPYGFEPFSSTSFPSMRTLHAASDIKKSIEKVILNEYPVHFEVICQRLAPLIGYERVCQSVRHRVESELIRMPKYICRDEFYFPKDYSGIRVRLSGDRKIQHIHKEEIAAAMKTIMQSLVGPTRKSLSVETIRALGFSRSSAQISAAMDEAINLLLTNNIIEEIDGKLRLI